MAKQGGARSFTSKHARGRAMAALYPRTRKQWQRLGALRDAKEALDRERRVILPDAYARPLPDPPTRSGLAVRAVWALLGFVARLRRKT